MLAVHLAKGKVEVRRQPVPKVPEGFARIRLLAAGICSTDLELQRGYYGFTGTPGHEFVGEVVEVNGSTSKAKQWIGQRVAGEINLGCGECNWCAKGLGRHCPTRTVLGIVKHPGAFSEFLTLPIRNLHRVPASIPTSDAVFIEPIGAACEIMDQVKIPKREPVGVLGDGKLGLLITQVLQAHGAQVHLMGRHIDKMRLVDFSGATTEIIRKKTPVSAFNFVVDSTGSSDGLSTAIAMCQPRGTVIMKSTVHGLVSINTAVPIVNEITLVGSRCGRFEPALKLLASGKVRVNSMISDEFPLDQAPAAFAKAASKGVLKVLLQNPK
jgi:alcohol dehydrogenase